MGLINQAVPKKFLARRLESWDWLKNESKGAVAETVRSLEPVPKFGKVKLWTHQKVCFLLMITLKRFMLFLDMGGGKTLTTLMVIRYLKKIGFKPRAIVFVPYVIAVDTWVEETAKWTNLKCVPLTDNSAINLENLNQEADLFVVCYQSAVAMFAKKTGKKRGKNPEKGWSLDAATVKKHTKGFNILVCDEIHRCRNVTSMTYRMCRAISKQVTYAFGLTGTPFGRNLEDLWAQFFLIDHGETLGNTLGLFRAVFFKQVINYWGGYEYKFKNGLMDKLKEIIKNRSIRYEISEIKDMPKKAYYVKDLTATADIANYYNKLVESMENLSFGRVKYRELESKYMRLRQLSSGFLTLNGDDSSKTEIEFPENPKLDALQDLIESMPENAKMIVFHDFRYTNVIISKRLKALKVPHARVYGGMKNSSKELRRFKRDPKCRVLVINCAAGSSSQNLQMANYVVYFEQPRSAIDRQQSERRAWRPGQRKRVLIFDLMMRDSTDQKQKNNNEEGTNLLKTVLDGRVKFKKMKV